MSGRKYRFARIEAGDYMVLSNDARTLWRVSSYEEDGSLFQQLPEGGEKAVVGHFWQTARFDGTPEQAEALLHRDPEEFLSWEHWQQWEALLPTRRAALASIFGEEQP